MKTIMWDPLSLKPLLGIKGGPKDAEFRKLSDFMDVVDLPGRTIIRAAGQVEVNSHVLLEGLVGMYLGEKLIRIFFKGDMFLDFESYAQQLPSRYLLRALNGARFTSLSFKNEIKVLNEIKDFEEVSGHLKARVRNSNEEWIASSQLHYMERLRAMEGRCPGLRLKIHVKELAGLLGIGRSTMIKLRKDEENNIRKAKSDAVLLKEITYPFKALKHEHREQLETISLEWAYTLHSFFTDETEFTLFKRNKQASLSSYLYPEIDFDKGLWISKFYVWLFYLDDKTGKLSIGSKEAFWKPIEEAISLYLANSNSTLPFLPSRISAIINAFQDLWIELGSMEGVSESQLDLIQTEILNHIKYSRIEARYLDNQYFPTIEEYLEMRPYTSGARLAVNFSCLEFQENEIVKTTFWEKTAELRKLSTQLIQMDNDFFSFNKEKKAGDHMNYITLLVKNEGMSLYQAKERAMEVRKSYFNDFMAQNKKWMEDFNPENHLILQQLKYIKYKISGARHWSAEISKRYE